MKKAAHFVASLTMIAILAGCAASRLHHDGVELIGAGKIEEGLTKLALAVDKAPTNALYRADYLSQRDAQVDKLLAMGKAQREGQRWQEANSSFERARSLSPLDPRSQDALIELARARGAATDIEQARAAIRLGDLDSARDLVGTVQAQYPGNREAANLLRQIEEVRAKNRMDNPVLRNAPGKTVSLRFADASVRMILEAIGRMSGLAMIIDRDIR